MAAREEVLKRWNFPHQQDHGVTLVTRADAPACVKRIVESGCPFFGYDSFIVRGDTIQPVMEFSPDWSEQSPPPLENILSQLSSHPSSITHYEFVFEDAQ